MMRLPFRLVPSRPEDAEDAEDNELSYAGPLDLKMGGFTVAFGTFYGPNTLWNSPCRRCKAKTCVHKALASIRNQREEITRRIAAVPILLDMLLFEKCPRSTRNRPPGTWSYPTLVEFSTHKVQTSEELRSSFERVVDDKVRFDFPGNHVLSSMITCGLVRQQKSRFNCEAPLYVNLEHELIPYYEILRLEAEKTKPPAPPLRLAKLRRQSVKRYSLR